MSKNDSVTVFHEGDVIERRAAAEQGLKYYFTGKPCSRRHVAQRFTSGFQCVVCSTLLAQKWRTENPEQRILNERRYRERNPEKREAASKKWRQAHPDVVKETRRQWRSRHPDKLAEYIERQRLNGIARKERLVGRRKPGACEACGDPEVVEDKGTRIVFDHCHASNVARGWICHNCNIALGHVKDSVPRLHKLVAYLNERQK